MLGVGRGYQTREVETLGGPLLDTEANAALFREQMEILFKAFDEEAWSHKVASTPSLPKFRSASTSRAT